MRVASALTAVMSLGLLAPIQAQERPSAGPAVYKVEFDVNGAPEGKPASPTHYSMLVDESRKGVFQATSRVPVENGVPPGVDVGTNIEVAVHGVEGKVALDGAIDISSVTGTVCLGSLCEPIIGQRKIAIRTTMELGTRRTIGNDRGLVEALVTKVN